MRDADDEDDDDNTNGVKGEGGTRGGAPGVVPPYSKIVGTEETKLT